MVDLVQVDLNLIMKRVLIKSRPELKLGQLITCKSPDFLNRCSLRLSVCIEEAGWLKVPFYQ